MSSHLAAFFRRQVRSTTDTLGVGTWKDVPVSFLFSSEITLLRALAAPGEGGMVSWAALQPSHHSFPDWLSVVFWVAVTAWTVVMSPSIVPELDDLGQGGQAVGGA